MQLSTTVFLLFICTLCAYFNYAYGFLPAEYKGRTASVNFDDSADTGIKEEVNLKNCLTKLLKHIVTKFVQWLFNGSRIESSNENNTPQQQPRFYFN
ncbi:hypothetical protein FQR65_LT08856 [Abscondita terminalis]|nr:hypothetical protein FQR65_LT08856 [Abscondita terminalis]